MLKTLKTDAPKGLSLLLARIHAEASRTVGTIGQNSTSPLPNANPFTFPNDVIFGLPWAVNVAGYPHVQVISRHLVDLLLKDGYSIYFSDIFKLYNSELGRDNYSKCMKNQAEATDAFNLLHDELKTINPCKVLLFGQKTFSQFQKFQETVSITYAINDGNWVKHPAAHWGKGFNDMIKAQYYHSII